MRCTKCGTDNAADARFCNQCAAPLNRRCPQCAHLNAPDAKFCAQCAVALGGRAAVGSDASVSPVARGSVRLGPETQEAFSTPDGERKTVTALFADITGSTELMRDLDPEEARAIVDPALKLMIDAAHRYDGYVVPSTGDGIFALFGAPVAHEDHPQRALHTAIAIRDELRRQSAELKQRGRVGVEVRIGINTGEVVLRMVHTGGHTEYTPVGHATNLASRMQSIAPAGGIVISEDTRRLSEGYFELRNLGPTEVKGISEPINVYEVIDVGPARGHFELATRRGLTKFVGREREVAELKRALELVRNGHGQIVAAVAEAGIGKSRLVYEFKAMLRGDCKVLEAYSVSHGKASGYLPVLQLLYLYFGIEEADDKAARRARIKTRINALDPVLNDTLPLLYTLMGLHEGPDPHAEMDPQIKRRRTLDAIKRIILRESLNQPTVVIFEDLHWIDGETQALLDLLADGIANARVLTLVNYRPEYRHEWTNKSYYAQLRLDALERESAREMLSTRLGDGVELNPLKRLIIERTGGNPFFMEEMVQTLFDEGALVRNGAVEMTRPLAQLHLPPTVQGILASRIDRLPTDQKDLLQTLAVIGRESPLALIRRVVPEEHAQLERMLSDLQAGEFIYEQPAAAWVEYTFKHALTQEVAYNSLLIERRKLLHERAGAAMEFLYADQLDDHLSDLAHHYGCTANSRKALEYLQRAGQQAAVRSAHAEALGLFTSALELLKTMPETPERIQQELVLQLGLGVSFMVIKQWSAPEVAQVYSRARELCRYLGDPPQLLPVLFGLNGFHTVRAELDAAHKLSSDLLEIAQRQQDNVLLANAHFACGIVLYFLGDLVAARTHLERVSSLYDPSQHHLVIRYGGHDPGVHSLCFQTFALWSLGYPDQAANRIRAAVRLAQEVSHPYSLGMAFGHGAIGYLLRRELPLAEDFTDAALRLSAEQGFAYLPIWIMARGALLVEQSRIEEGIASLREGLAATRAQGQELGRTFFLSRLAEAHIKWGQAKEGLATITEALDAAYKTGEHVHDAELYRLRGELSLQLGVPASGTSVEAEAEADFRRAIEVAQNQSAKSPELRATTSMARLLAKQGRRDEASAMLAEIYGWFTEGFDTADLNDAKALLDGLAE